MNDTYNVEEYIQAHVVGRLENLMNGGGMYDDVTSYDSFRGQAYHIRQDEDYGYFLHKQMKPYYKLYLYGDTRLCKANMENVRLFMKEVIEEDGAFGEWASGQDLRAATEGWGDNMKRIEEPKRMNQYFQVLRHLFNTGCRQDWRRLSEELQEDLFRAEVCADYKTDEVLCVLHGFTMIMQQDWTQEMKGEQIDLLFTHWKFLKYYYSIMIRHIIGVKYTRWTDVTNTVMTSSSSFNPHMHIYYCGLTERMDSLGLDFKQYKKLDDIRLQMLAKINSCEPSETLYALCDAIFPEDFQRMLQEHRPRSYREMEDESHRKDELIRQLRDQSGRACKELEKSRDIIERMVLSSIPIEDIDAELEQYPAGTAWDMLSNLNASPVISMQRAWREHYPELLRKYRQRLLGPIEQQNELKDAMMKIAERPTYNYEAGATHDDKRSQLVLGEGKDKVVQIKRLRNE